MIYTFYSYKGGVGRTMALANIAEIYHQGGVKVLMVDWDLEAPGLDRFFTVPGVSLRDQPGVMDLILDYKEKMAGEELEFSDNEAEWPFDKPWEFAVDVDPKRERGKEPLWLLTAGRRDPNNFRKYASDVLAFDWIDFYDNWAGEQYIEWLRRRFEEMADIVLIDSRTGVTEISGICTYQLADVVVMFCAPNEQNLEGTYQMAQRFLSREIQEVRPKRPLQVAVIPTRMEQAESDRVEKFKEKFIKRFDSLSLMIAPREVWRDLSYVIPYIPRYAYEEEVAAREPETTYANPLARVYKRIAEFLLPVNLLLDKIRDGDKSLADGKFVEAINAYTDALNLGGNKILKYHRQLERKRDQTRDLLAWEERVLETLRQAKRDLDTDNPAAALQKLSRLLAEMPDGKHYDDMRARLLDAHHSAATQMGDTELIQRARRSLAEQNPEECLRLVKNIPPDSSHYETAQKLADHAQNELVQRAWQSLAEQNPEECLRLVKNIPPDSSHYKAAQRLADQAQNMLAITRPRRDNVQKLYREGRWGDAFAELDALRKDFPESPIWHDLWLWVTMDYGRHELDAGRQANEQGDFRAARRHFEEARRAFEKTLELYENHRDARRLRDEAFDLARIATDEEQAKQAWKKGDRQAALTALDSATRRLEQARQEGWEYVTVGAMVEHMRETLQRELDRIQEEERQLRDGKRLLENRKLAEAAEQFRLTLNALLERHRNQAKEGLNRAEAEIEAFQKDMERGRRAKNPATAVKAYQAAYDRWPDGPEARESLERALLQAGRAARERGRDKEAADYFNWAVKLTGSPDAKLELRRMDDAPVIVSELEREELKDLLRRLETKSSDFDAMERRLEKLGRRARPYEDLHRELQNLLDELAAHRKRWAMYESQRDLAREHQRAGRWREAVAALKKGLESLGESAPSDAHRMLDEWQGLVHGLKETEPKVRDRLQEARQAYETVAESREFSRPVETVEQALSIIGEIEEDVLQASGILPDSLRGLREEAEDLQRRAQAVREAYSKPPADGLLIIREARAKWPEDQTLQTLMEDLEEKAKAEVERLIRQADEAQGAGELTEALDLLRRARELAPDHPDVEEQYTALRRRMKLEEQLRSIENDFVSKQSTGSPVEARDALRKGLEMLLNPDYGLSDQAREILGDLLRQEQELAFADDAVWQEARQKSAAIGQLGKDWLSARTARLVENWIQTARDVALRGVVASEVQLGNLVEAYKAAEAYLKSRPTDDEAIEQLADLRGKIISRLERSIGKRLERAQEALEQGEVETAADNLTSIREEFYRRVEEEIPDVLEFPPIEALRTQEAELLGKVEQLREIYENNRPHLERAQDYFVNGQLEEAEQELQKLSGLEELPRLKSQADALRERIKEAQLERAVEEVHRVVYKSLAEATLATRPEEIEEARKELRGLPERVDFSKLPQEERDLYYRALEQVRERIASFETRAQ